MNAILNSRHIGSDAPAGCRVTAHFNLAIVLIHNSDGDGRRKLMGLARRSARRTIRAMLPLFSPIRVDTFRDRVAVNAERRGGVSDSLLISRVGFLDVKLLEFFERLVQHDVAVEHVFNYSFEAGADLHRLSPN